MKALHGPTKIGILAPLVIQFLSIFYPLILPVPVSGPSAASSKTVSSGYLQRCLSALSFLKASAGNVDCSLTSAEAGKWLVLIQAEHQREKSPFQAHHKLSATCSQELRVNFRRAARHN